MPFIIFLNGTSSAGKTSIAKKIQELSNLPFIHLEIDTFLGMVRFQHIDCEDIDGVNEICQLLISGFHNCFGSMVKTGNHIIIDHVLQEPNWLYECLSILKDQKVYLVGVHCSIDTLNKREINRSNRPIGLAALQFSKVHEHSIYDIEIDSEKQSDEESAKQILDYVNELKNPTAWTQLISKYNIK